MVKSIKAVLQRTQSNNVWRGRRLAWFLILSFYFCSLILVSSLSQAYTDQIVIEMPNAAKTIYDIRIHSFIRHLFEQSKITDPMSNSWLNSQFEAERKNYVEQYLAQNYVVENGLNLKPTPEEVKAITQKINRLFSSTEARKKSYERLGIQDDDVRSWVTNRLILNNFLSNSMQDRIAITDQKLTSHYQTWKGSRFPDKPYEEVESMVKDDLSKTLLKEEFDKWVDQEKRRQKMILKMVSTS